MLDAVLEYTSTGHVPSIFMGKNAQYQSSQLSTKLEIGELPKRMDGNHLSRHSKVLLSEQGGIKQYRSLPTCPKAILAIPIPLNKSAPM